MEDRGACRRSQSTTEVVSVICHCAVRRYPLLDVFQCQQCAVVLAGGVDGAGDDGGETLAEFGVLGGQGFDHGYVVLVSVIGIGDVRGLILDHKINVVANSDAKHIGEVESLSFERQVYGIAARRKISGLEGLRLVIDPVGNHGAHEGHGSKQVAGLIVIKPGVAGLSFGFKFACAIPKPLTIVTRHLGGFDLEASQLPFISDFL